MATRSSRKGILGYGAYVPFRRLDRSEIAPVAGRGGGKGTRSVASYDEDTTTMAVEATRPLLSALSTTSRAEQRQNALWFATTSPAYVDKTNATAIHAALQLDPSTPAFDVNGSVRSAIGALRAGLSSGNGSALVVTADIRVGLPGSPDEATGGDAAAALLVGEADDDTPLLAEVLGWGHVSDELLDRWRTPGATSSQVWEERFGEGPYVEAGERAFEACLKDASVSAGEIDHLVVVGAHDRARKRLRRTLLARGAGDEARATSAATTAGAATDRALTNQSVEPPQPATAARRLDAALLESSLLDRIGFSGAAHPGLALAGILDDAGPGRAIALVVLADGADVLLLRTTDALAERRQSRPLVTQVAAGAPVSYGTYLAWRGLLTVEPPRRPEPARPSAPAAHRSAAWKFGFVGSQDEHGTVQLPPPPGQGDTADRPMAGASGTIATFTVDRMAYSPSPPVVFAVVDFDGGGRLPVELTDVDAADVHIGQRVEMTFRKLFTADGIHNYFWKARPLQDDVQGQGG